MAWLNDAINLKSLGTDENLMDRFVSIAESYTEETLQESAQKLEKSDVWKCSDRLRDWFSSKWLAEAKVSKKILIFIYKLIYITC